MSRLSSVLTSAQRSSLSRQLCDRAADSVRDAGLGLVVVSSSPDVKEWAESREAVHWADPGRGLSAAATSAVSRLGDSPWIVLHADLPLVTAQSLATVSNEARHNPVLVPSQDGGTNVIASVGMFPFASAPDRSTDTLPRTRRRRSCHLPRCLSTSTRLPSSEPSLIWLKHLPSRHDQQPLR